MQKLKRPSWFKFFTEPVRALNERRYAHNFLKNYATSPKGDGHPILVIPGFLGNDQATHLLRQFLVKLGYTPIPWDMGLNLGNIKKINLLLQKIEELHQEHRSKITLIGWSLGGVYARQLAKERPEWIREVITLGAPFAGMEEPNNAAWLFRLINDRRELSEEDKKWMVDIPSPPPVPTLSIFSKDDGIVPWEACMEPEPNDKHQNAEVKGSHVGMPHNIQIWAILEAYLPAEERPIPFFEKVFRLKRGIK